MQRQAEGKMMHFIMNIIISIISFFSVMLFLFIYFLQKAAKAASVCESVLSYDYRVVIVSLDCSSDSQQIKLNGDIL